MTEYPPPRYGPPAGYPSAYPHAEPQGPAHGRLATAALVLGIIGFAFGCIPFVNFVAFPLVLLAIVFGCIAFSWGKAKAGAILGVLGLAAAVLWSVAIAGAFNKASDQLDRYRNCVDRTPVNQVDSCDRYLNN